METAKAVPNEQIVTTNIKVKKRSVLSRLAKNKVAFFSLWFLLLIHIIVFIGPLVWSLDPEK